MALTRKELINGLNDLIETCRDSEEGFQTTADGVRFAQYRLLFENFARERAGFVAELQALVRQFGGDPETEGSTAGLIQKGWLEITSVLSGESESAMLEECKRGEKAVMQNYQAALQKQWPQPVLDTIQRQYQAISQTYDKLNALQEVVPDTQKIP